MNRLLITVLAFGVLLSCLATDLSPRLFFTDRNISHLKTPEGRSQVIKLADEYKKNRMEAWSLAYRVTGEKKYAQKVRDKLLKDCVKNNRPWPNGLNGAQRCYEMALGFDCIRDFLASQEREAIAKGLVSRGIEPMLGEWLYGKTRSTTLDSMGHNWWSACVFLPGVAALAVVDEIPEMRPVLERIKAATKEWFEYPGSVINNKPSTFDRAGGFYEGVGYGNFALSCYLIFHTAWSNARQDSLPEIPLLEKTGDFFLNSCYPTEKGVLSLNFGDSSLHADGSQPLVWLWAAGFRQPRYLWYLKQVVNTEFKEAIQPNSPLGLVFYPTKEELAKAPALPDLPHSALYPDMGWGIMRNSWGKDATLLAVKSGFTWNHAHADAGSFILFHRGENLLIDSGNCWYVHPQYDAYYRQSTAHNVVLFNGEGENPEDTYHGSKFPGAILTLIDAGSLKYLLADATGPVSQNFIRNYRSFLWIDEVILVIDDLKTFRPGKFEWLIHTGGDTTRKGLNLNVKRGNAAVAIRPLFPEQFPEGFPHDFPERLQLVEKTGLGDHAQNTPVPYYAIVPPGEARKMKFVNAILLNPDQAPKIERLESANALGVRIIQGDKTTEVWLNLLADGRMRHRNSNNTLATWDTDAYLLAITTEKDKPTRFFIGNGSYLRRGDNLLLDSLRKVFAIIDNGKLTKY